MRRVESMMQRCRTKFSGTLAAAGPVAREVVIAPKCALSPRRSHSSMACVIQHRRTLALRHHLLIKRKKDIVAASYNAVDALNFFVGRRSSKINQSASGIRFERSLSRRASYVLSRTTRPPRFQVLYSSEDVSIEVPHSWHV
jgi:hypothetical protein